MKVNVNSMLYRTLFALLKITLFEGSSLDEEHVQFVRNHINEIYYLAVVHDVSHILADSMKKLGISECQECIKK